MKHVLVVCHANRYRSPLAAAVLAGYSRLIMVRSAGFKQAGRSAAKCIREEAERRGLDLVEHCSDVVNPALLAWADIVLYMDGGNLKRLQALRPSGPHPKQRWLCLGQFAKPAVRRIPDPAFVSAKSPEFRAIMDQIVDAAHNFALRYA